MPSPITIVSTTGSSSTTPITSGSGQTVSLSGVELPYAQAVVVVHTDVPNGSDPVTEILLSGGGGKSNVGYLEDNNGGGLPLTSGASVWKIYSDVVGSAITITAQIASGHAGNFAIDVYGLSPNAGTILASYKSSVGGSAPVGFSYSDAIQDDGSGDISSITGLAGSPALLGIILDCDASGSFGTATDTSGDGATFGNTSYDTVSNVAVCIANPSASSIQLTYDNTGVGGSGDCMVMGIVIAQAGGGGATIIQRRDMGNSCYRAGTRNMD